MNTEHRTDAQRERVSNAARQLNSTRVLLGLTLVLGVLLRAANLSNALWVDERITKHFVTTYTIPQLVTAIPVQQPHLPGYYIFARAWIDAGLPFDALEYVSFIAGLAIIPATYQLAARWRDGPTAVTAAAFVATSPLLVIQSSWIRMYAIFTLITVLWLTILTTRTPSTRREILAHALTVVLATIHPFSLLVLAPATVAMYASPRWPQARRRRLTATLGLPTLAGGGFLLAKLIRPSLAGSVKQVAHVSSTHDVIRVLAAPSATLTGSAFLPGTILATILLAFLAIAVVSRDVGRDSAGRWLFAWTVVPILGLGVLTQVHSVFYLKYVGFLAPGYAIVFADCARRLPNRLGGVLESCLVSLAMIHLLVYYVEGTFVHKWSVSPEVWGLLPVLAVPGVTT